MPSQKTHMDVVVNRTLEMVPLMRKNSRYALSKTAERMEADAKSRLAPGKFGYKTGQARDSIHGRVVDGDNASGGVCELSGGGDEAPYFAYNEFGTRYRASAPALVPAFERNKDQYESYMQKVWATVK